MRNPKEITNECIDCQLSFTRMVGKSQYDRLISGQRKYLCPGCISLRVSKRTSGKIVCPQRRKYIEPGTRKFDKDGYVHLRIEDKNRPSGGYWAYEHRVVMQKILGRTLKRHETVHHKNGIRSDNSQDNLELWRSYHPGGQRIKDLIIENLNYLSKEDLLEILALKEKIMQENSFALLSGQICIKP